MGKLNFDQINKLPNKVKQHGIQDVYTIDEMQEILQNFSPNSGGGVIIGGANTSLLRQSGVFSNDTATINITLPEFSNGEALFLFIGGIYQTPIADYVLDFDGKILSKAIGNWDKDFTYDILVLDVADKDANTTIDTLRFNGVITSGQTLLDIPTLVDISEAEVMLFIGGLYKTAGIDYILNKTSKTITSITNWEESFKYDIIVIDGKSSTTPYRLSLPVQFGTIEPSLVSSIPVTIPGYKTATDDVVLYIGGLLMTKGVNYTVDILNKTIVNLLEPWTVGYTYDIVLFKDMNTTSSGGSINGANIDKHSIPLDALEQSVIDAINNGGGDNADGYEHPATHPVEMITGAVSTDLLNSSLLALKESILGIVPENMDSLKELMDYVNALKTTVEGLKIPSVETIKHTIPVGETLTVIPTPNVTEDTILDVYFMTKPTAKNINTRIDTVAKTVTIEKDVSDGAQVNVIIKLTEPSATSGSFLPPDIN